MEEALQLQRRTIEVLQCRLVGVQTHLSRTIFVMFCRPMICVLVRSAQISADQRRSDQIRPALNFLRNDQKSFSAIRTDRKYQEFSRISFLGNYAKKMLDL